MKPSVNELFEALGLFERRTLDIPLPTTGDAFLQLHPNYAQLFQEIYGFSLLSSECTWPKPAILESARYVAQIQAEILHRPSEVTFGGFGRIEDQAVFGFGHLLGIRPVNPRRRVETDQGYERANGGLVNTAGVLRDPALPVR